MAKPRRAKGRQRLKATTGGRATSAPKAAKGPTGGVGKPTDEKPHPQKRALPADQLMKALGHPLRLKILAILADRIASPKEISNELDETIGDVNYHAKVLQNSGLIIEDHQIPRRGALEHFYRAAAPTVIPPGTWDRFPGPVQKGVSARILKKFLDDARASMEAGLFDDPPAELSWTPLILDQTGIEEIEQLVGEFLDSALEVQANTTQRLPKDKSERAAEARSATIFLASFLSARSPEDDKKASSRKRR